MCNLNVLFKIKNNPSVTGFLQSISANSYTRNSDGDGIFTSSDNKVNKSLEKLDYYKYKNNIDNSNVIITHQRLSTSGHTLEFVHPFESKDFVLVHNGVINQFLEETGSDTSGFFKKFINEFNKDLSHNSRDIKIFNVLKKLLKSNEGWYSIFLYDKKTKKTYYFKNKSPNINFYEFDNYLFVSTIAENKMFIPMISNSKVTEYNIKDYVLYKIEIINNKIKIISLGKYYKEKIFDSQVWLNNYINKSNNLISDYALDNCESQESICSQCKKPAKNIQYIKNKQIYCLDCWEKEC